MVDLPEPRLLLENRHTGERLAIARVERDGVPWFALEGSLPPHREGPPMHVHFAEDEEGFIRAGVLSAIVQGRPVTAGPGESTFIPRGVAHRWWNAGDGPLVFTGFAGPAVDLDRYLQAVFDVMNAGPPGRPPLWYMAKVALRHRRTQAVHLMPAPIQALFLRACVGLGSLLGRYRGADWPGSPARCPGLPTSTSRSHQRGQP